jgi:hypothetical protein
MKFKLLILNILTLLFFGVNELSAQENIPASGSNASGSGGSVSYSIGQLVYSNNTGPNGTASEGVQQPFEISVVTGIDEAKNIQLNCTVFPNPTTDFLILEVQGDIQKQYFANLIDLTGKLISRNEISGNKTKIFMMNLLPSVYFLKIVQYNNEIKTFKIVKN